MNIIHNNPFRTIGILVGASTREEHTKSRKLKMYVEADQEVPEDFSLPFFDALDRSIENIEEAISKLNLNKDRLNAALFWFYNGNPISDEVALDALKEGDTDIAVNIWWKLVHDEEDDFLNVSKKNASAFNNLSTLFMLDNSIEESIEMKLLFLESDYYSEVIKKATDENFKISKKELQLLFLNTLVDQRLIDTDDLLDIIIDLEFSAKEEFLKDFVQKPIEQIEQIIAEARAKRKADKAKAISIGEELFEQTKDRITQLKSILGVNNLKFSSISDKVSDEILQCGIDYYKHFKNSDTDPSSAAMKLFHKAKTLAVGNIAKQRCQENTENLQEWIDDKPERDKHNRIKKDLTSLFEIFDQFDNKKENIQNAKLLINLCKSHLNNIKNILGASDDMYLKLSTRVASQAQSYVIEEVNDVQDNLEYKIALDRYGTLFKIKTTLRAGWEVTNLIGALDMEYDFKTGHFNQNKQALRKLCNQLDVSTPSYDSSSPSTTSRPSYASTPSSSSTPKPSYNAPKSNSDNINWGGWIFGIILFIIIIKSCSAASKNEYENDTVAIDSSAIFVDSAAVSVDSTASYVDSAAAYVDSAATPSEKEYTSPYIGNQLQNGSSPFTNCFGSPNYEGNASLTIKNGGNSDAIVCLYSTLKDRTIRNSYVQKNSSFTMKSIEQGYYKIRVIYGNDWNPELVNSCGTYGNFESDVNFSEFDDEEYFEDSSRGYTNATITLYTVANGNASTSTIDQSSFFNK